MTRGEAAQAEVAALLRARHTLLWVTSAEEARVERALVEAVGAAKYEVRLWDCEQGITKPGGDVVEQINDPQAALAWLGRAAGRVVLVMRDLHRWVADPSMCRSLRNAQRRMQALPPSGARAVVALAPSGEIPPDLRGNATAVDWPLPDRAEIAKLLSDSLSALPESLAGRKLEGEAFEAAVDAAVGLSASEAENCYALSLVSQKRVDPARVAAEKKRVISRVPGLSWYEPDPRGLDAVGGLDNLKAWLRARSSAFGARARAYGLPAPKGALLVGVPGGGKSLTAKALASAWGVPLVRWDVGAMRSKFVGDSEANVRRALQIVESIGRCVLWLDEVEKALAGSTGPQGDGGVAADALGQILSWMQERTCEAFVLATANDVRALPPELLRKGRFDEVWWVDLPTRAERASIVRAALAQYGRELPAEGVDAVADATPGFVGAEIAALVPEALFAAFADGERPVAAADLVRAAAETVPLSKTAAGRIEELRAWAKGRARAASPAEAETAGNTRKLDLS